MPLTAAGCSQTACFTWSQDEGECPAQGEALQFFRDPRCPSSVVSVDSDGDYGNNLCCYTVTKQDTGRGDDSVPCAAFPVDPGGVGGFGGTGSAVGTGVGFPLPPSPTCFGCSRAFASSLSLNKPICPQSQVLFDAVNACICKGACSNSCQDTLCANREADSVCLSCLSDTAMGCGAEFDACANDN